MCARRRSNELFLARTSKGGTPPGPPLTRGGGGARAGDRRPRGENYLWRRRAGDRRLRGENYLGAGGRAIPDCAARTTSAPAGGRSQTAGVHLVR